jgi:hypothetical protein
VCGGTGMFDEAAEISDGACSAPAPRIMQIG